MASPLVGWDRWRSAFEALLDPRFYTIEWLYGEIMDGRIRLLETDCAAVLVAFKDYPTGAKEIHGMSAVGDLADIVDILIPAAENFGRNHGCIRATIESREGWKRVLEPSGYQPHQICLRKEL